MSDLPTNWSIVNLKDVVSYSKGKKPKVLSETKSDELIPYIDIQAFKKGSIRQYADIKSSKIADKNDVLVVWDGARSGLVGMGMNGAIGSTLVALKTIEIESEYLFRFLQTQYRQINSNPRGTGIPHVDPELFWNIEVPIAPVKEQRRIIERLNNLLPKVQSCQERLDEIPAILKRFRQAVLAAACSGRLTEDWREKQEDNYDNILPNTWKMTSIDQLVSSLKTDLRTGPFGSMLKKSEHQKNGIPVWGIESIGLNGKFNYENKNFVTKEKARELKSFIVKGGDIIISRSGTVGELCILPEDVPYSLISTNLMKISLNRDIINPKFFCFLFEGSQIVIDKLNELCSGSTRLFLTQKILKQLSFPLPSLKEQNEIVTRVESFFKLADKIETRYNKIRAYLDIIPQSILAKAFRGELVPQDPNDEPASVLLERIRKEKKLEGGSRADGESNRRIRGREGMVRGRR